MNQNVTSSVGYTGPVSKKMLWVGWIISVLPALMLLFSAGMKFAKPAAVVEGFNHLGYPERLGVPLGIVEIGSTILYLVPQTSILGAILLTGFLGGATSAHVRVGEPFFMPIVLGVFVWAGIFLRNPRLRRLIPFRSRPG